MTHGSAPRRRPERPAKIETVLLDAGGVLLDLDYPYLCRLLDARGCRTAPEALARGEALARAEIQKRVREGERAGEMWRDYFHYILAHVHAPLEAHDPIIKTLWEAHQRFGLWTAAIPGAVETVRGLRDRYRLGVVSNAEGRVQRDLDLAGFDGMFSTVVDSFLVGVEKPDPRIFEIALQRLGANAESTVYVGDVPSVDVAGARAANIAAVLLDRHDLYRDVTAPRLRSISELPAWLNPGSPAAAGGRSGSAP